MGKTRRPRRILAAFLFTLYIVSPYLNILTPQVFADQSSTPDQSTGDTPLPPGTVTNLGSCPPAAPSHQPLTNRSEWSLTLSIPKLLFMGTKSGSNITDRYQVFDDGTFSTSDDAGNNYTIKPLGGFPPGITTISLKANSTTAFQNWLVQAGPHIFANVTVVYTIKHQFCEPSGLKLTIEGTIDWGGSHSGRIIVPFNHKPLSVKTRRAWFGNQSGEALGFDWTDSLGQKPQFDSAAYQLSYPVNGTFTIDPVTISTTTAADAFDFGYQHPICYAASRFWLFYEDGSNYGYRTSTDGNTWTPETTLTTAGSVVTETSSFTCTGTTVFYAIPVLGVPYSRAIYYRYGNLNPDGTISWAISESSMNITNTVEGYGNSVAIDANGDLWLAASAACNTPCGNGLHYLLEVWECTNPSSCSWSSVGWPLQSTIGAPYYPDVVNLGSTVAVIYATPNDNSTEGKMAAMAYLGNNTWTTPSQSGETCIEIGCGMFPNYGMGVATLGSTLEIATAAFGSRSGNHPAYLSYTVAGGLSAVSNPDGVSNNDCTSGCSISSYGSTNLVFWMAGVSSVSYMSSSDGGATWSAKTTVMNGTASTQARIAAGYGDGHSVVVYETGTSSPYNVEFAEDPPPPAPVVAVPPWGGTGLSPYGSYLNNAAVYVSTTTGLVSIEQPTFSLPGRGLSVAPALLYDEPGTFWASGVSPANTDNFTLSFIGLGWSLNLPWLGTYSVHLADGEQFPYSWTGTDMQVHGPVDFELTSTSTSGGCPCTLIMPSGVQFAFNIAKQLVSETDSTGNNTVSYAYGSNGMLSTLTDTIGRQVTFGYSSNRLSSITAPGGRTWNLAYAAGQVSFTDPVGRVTVFKSTSSPASNWLIGEVDYPIAGAKVLLSYTAGSELNLITYFANSRNIYSASGIISQSDSMSYTESNNNITTIKLTESDGSNTQGIVVTNFAFSPSNQGGTMVVQYETASGTVFRRGESDFAGNRLTAAKVEDASGNVLAQSTYSYDNWGNLVDAKDNVGHETFASYANTGSSNFFASPACSTTGFYSNSISTTIHDRLVGSCDFQGGAGSFQQETFFQYNAAGELTEEKDSHNGGWLYTDIAYDRYGNAVSTKDADGNTRLYSYSSTYGGAYLTQQSQIAGSQNITARYGYDPNTGFETSATDPNGQSTLFAYDVLGRLLKETYPAVGGVSSIAQTAYDDVHGIVTTADPNGNVAKAYFDGLGREIKLENWNGSSVYSTTLYTYNWMDQESSMKTPLGRTYSYSYDSVGRLTGETFPDSTSTSISYNDFANIVIQTDQNGHQTTNVYDWNGQLTSVTQSPASGVLYTTGYSYDGVGNLLTVDNGIGQITTYTYDDLNRLTSVTTPDGFSTSYNYDSVGNPVSKVTPNGATINYNYDQASRLSSISYPDGSGTSYTYDQAGNVLTISSTLSGATTDIYTYDPMGRLSSSAVTVAGGTYTTNFAYDKASNLVKVTYPDASVASMTYDALNRLKKVGSYATFAYNTDGGITSITFGDGEVQSYAYDNLDRPTSITDKSGSNTLLSLPYTYDKASNVLSVGSDRYTYDNMNRVATARGGWGTTTYTYDGASNILGSTTGSATTVYKCGYYPNSLSGTVITCGTDKDGNFVSKTGGWTYGYDYQDELTAVQQNGNTVQTNIYDGSGNRVEMKEADSTVYAYVGVNLLFEKDVTKGTIITHIYGNGMQVAKLSGGTTYYYHEDQTGSNRLVTYVRNNRVTTQFSSDYQPYGANYQATGSEVFQYADRILDPVTGLYYFNARFYDPSIMRFTSKDPVAGTKLDPSTQNPYSYVGGNPLSNADPTGMDWWNNWNDFVNAVEGVSNEIQGWFAQANDYIESKSGRRPLTWEEYCGHACEEFPGLREYGWPTLLVTTSLIAPEGWGFYSIDIGEAGEINFQDLLAGEGLQTERGLWMNAETGEIIKTDAILKRPWVQMDLYSYEYRWLIDTKVGYQSGTETLEEAQWQSKLLSKGYLRGISWVSLPNSLGKMGWSANLASKLLWTYGIKTWKIPYP